MSTHDYIVDNQNGANFRSDLNNALAAIVSNNSKATAPTTTYAFMWWADTAADILKQRNAADSAWINILTLSTGAPLGALAASLVSGTHTNFTSTGIDDNATSTAITIDASENITCGGIVTIDGGTGYGNLEIGGDSGAYIDLKAPHSDDYDGRIICDGTYLKLESTSGTPVHLTYGAGTKLATTSTGIDVTGSVTCDGFTSTGIDDNATSTAITITSDGRGLSPFTAKAWVNFNGTGTVAIRDSHNVSSITDNATGTYTINFANNMSNVNYTFNYIANVTSTRMALNRLYDNMTVSSFKVRADEWEGLSTSSSVSRDSSICLAQVFGD